MGTTLIPYSGTEILSRTKDSLYFHFTIPKHVMDGTWHSCLLTTVADIPECVKISHPHALIQRYTGVSFGK